jgi:hypothetical protein
MVDDAHERSASSAGFLRRRWWQVTIVVWILGALWFAGTFDHLLVNVGLNAKECGRNGLGATLCGHELDEYRARVRVPSEQVRRSEAATLAREVAAREKQREAEEPAEPQREVAEADKVQGGVAAERERLAQGTSRAP